jgi:bacterioferritin-associated ferredoxin
MSNKAFICRCEDLTREEIEAAIDQGCTTLTELKNQLRLGMGPCQGRGCLTLARRILCEKTGKKPSEVEYPSVRPPEVPVLLGVLATGDED